MAIAHRSTALLLVVSLLLPIAAHAQTFPVLPAWGLMPPFSWITTPDGTGFVGLAMNFSPAPTPYSHSGQDIAVDVWKAGLSGEGRSAGIGVNHIGLGSGDNFYSQLGPQATEFFDALFRGDVYASGDGASGFRLNVFNASSNFQPFGIMDARPVITGSYGQAAMQYEAATAGARGTLQRFVTAPSFTGQILQVWAGAGYVGPYLDFALDGLPKFRVYEHGDLEVRQQRGITGCVRGLLITGGVVTGEC